MAKFINGRWVTDAELYPEQFEELPEEAESRKERAHAVRLSDIGSEEEQGRGKSREKCGLGAGDVNRNASDVKKISDSILGGTVPAWKKDKNAFGTVNLRKNDSGESAEDDETVEGIYGKKRRETAKAYAMKTVAAGGITERKLRDKLEARGYSEDEIEEAIEYVKGFGYVNDGRLAQDMVEKLAARLWGRFKICYYLKGKGISEEVIENLDFSEIDFPYYCACLMKKYPPERREAMLRAVKNAGYTSDDVRMARALIADED